MDVAALLYAEALLKLLVRSGAIPEAEVAAMADEQDLLAGRNPDEAEARREVAHQLRCALLDIDPPPTVAPAVQHRADMLRRHMVERTARLDGGNRAD
jgi:hypothetical protein